MKPFVLTCAIAIYCLVSGCALAQYQTAPAYGNGYQQQRKMSPVPSTNTKQQGAASYNNQNSNTMLQSPQNSYESSRNQMMMNGADQYANNDQSSTQQEATEQNSYGSMGATSALGAAQQKYGATNNKQQQAAYGNNNKQPAKYEEPQHPPMPFAWGYDINDGYGNTQYHKENNDENGKRTGSYGYRDAYGVWRYVDYVADENGFRATVKTNEPGTANEAPADVDWQAEEPPAKTNPGSPKKDYGTASSSSSSYSSDSGAGNDQSGYGKQPMSSMGTRANQASGYGQSSAMEPGATMMMKQQGYGGANTDEQQGDNTYNGQSSMMENIQKQAGSSSSMRYGSSGASTGMQYGSTSGAMSANGSGNGMRNYNSRGGNQRMMSNKGSQYGQMQQMLAALMEKTQKKQQSQGYGAMNSRAQQQSSPAGAYGASMMMDRSSMMDEASQYGAASALADMADSNRQYGNQRENSGAGAGAYGQQQHDSMAGNNQAEEKNSNSADSASYGNSQQNSQDSALAQQYGPNMFNAEQAQMQQQYGAQNADSSARMSQRIPESTYASTRLSSMSSPATGSAGYGQQASMMMNQAGYGATKGASAGSGMSSAMDYQRQATKGLASLMKQQRYNN